MGRRIAAPWWLWVVLVVGCGSQIAFIWTRPGQPTMGTILGTITAIVLGIAVLYACLGVKYRDDDN